MKPIKMFGLAALTALMAMAFVGASAAMASEPTALCNQDPGTGLHAVCPAGHFVLHVHETTLASNQGKLLAGFLTVECDVLFLGDALEDLANGHPLSIHGNFTYTNCGGCTVDEESADSLIKVLKTAHELASVTGEGEVHVNCAGLNCYYNGTGLEGHALGPLLSTHLNGDISISEQEVNKVKGLFCPSSGKLDLLTTPLTLVWITE